MGAPVVVCVAAYLSQTACLAQLLLSCVGCSACFFLFVFFCHSASQTTQHVYGVAWLSGCGVLRVNGCEIKESIALIYWIGIGIWVRVGCLCVQ